MLPKWLVTSTLAWVAVTPSNIQLTRTTSSDVVPNKKQKNAVRTILTSYSVKGLQAVNVDLGYFTTSGYDSINLINLCYSVGPIHWALSLRDLPRSTVSSKSRTLSPTCNFISPDVLS